MKQSIILTTFLFLVLVRHLEAQFNPPQYAISGDTCIFDIHCENIIIDTSQPNNLWQIGKPSKVVFDTAYTGVRAIATDSINTYDTNNISSFTMQLVHHNTIEHEIVFWHKYETTVGKDGGYIEMSYDMGETWINIIDYEDYPLWFQHILSKNLYNFDDSVHGDFVGYSGSSNEWIKSHIAWDMRVEGINIDEKVNRDTTLLRFTFISDSIQDNLDGWCIDNIVHLNYKTTTELESIQKNYWVKLYPNPCLDFVCYETQIPVSDIEIYDVMGSLVAKYDNKGKNIPVSCLSQGIYLVVFYSNNQIKAIEKLLRIE